MCPGVLSGDDHTDYPRPQVGVAAKLPSGPDDPRDLDYRSFWDFLMRKGQSRGKIPSERLQGIAYVPIY